MRVKDLIIELQQQDQEALVLLYVHEEWNGIRRFQTKERELNPNTALYYKADSPESCGVKGNYILLTD